MIAPKPLCLVLFIAAFAAAHAAPGPVDLLLVGDDDALQPLIQRLESPQIESHGAWTIWFGRLSGKPIVLTRSEGDPLNAVAATTLAVRYHPPHLIVVFGSARAHDPALHSGDVVVSEKFAAFDGMISPTAAIGAGSNALNWQILPHALMTPGEKENYVASFPASAEAAALALTLSAPHGRVVRGVLGSAGQVNRETDRVVRLRAQWSTSTEDGESAHVAGCAELLNVPLVGFRIVDGTSADAAAFVLSFVEKWK